VPSTSISAPSADSASRRELDACGTNRRPRFVDFVESRHHLHEHLPVERIHAHAEGLGRIGIDGIDDGRLIQRIVG
jgi:hypothetical protein